MRLRKFGPLPADHNSPKACAACGKEFVTGDYQTLIPLGPGDDEESRQRMRKGRVYNAVAAIVHWDCAHTFGEEG